jgi:hypothetical protein
MSLIVREGSEKAERRIEETRQIGDREGRSIKTDSIEKIIFTGRVRSRCDRDLGLRHRKVSARFWKY